MKTTITARHFKAPEKLRKYAENEVMRLGRFFDKIIDCDIILDYVKANNSKHSAEINMKVYGQILSVSVMSDDMFKSIDQAVKKLERQLKKYKGRLRSFKNEKAVQYVVEDRFLEEE